MSVLKWVIGGAIGIKVLKSKKESREEAKKLEQEKSREDYRKSIPCVFDNGITESEFAVIVRRAISNSRKIKDCLVSGPVVFCTVVSGVGDAYWSFKIDFNDFGHITGKYWILSDYEDVAYPTHIAKKIEKLIKTFPQWVDDEFEEELDQEETGNDQCTIHFEKARRKKCPHCSVPVKLADAKFCTACGKSLS